MRLRYILLLCVALISASAAPSKFGIVHGPKGAFNISAPKGWVIDNTAGKRDGLPCVLYPEGATWQNADPLMYTKIAGTDVTDFEAFAKKAISEMEKQRGEFKPKRIETGKTSGGQDYFINEYPAGEGYSRSERVAYIQMPKAVAYVVYSADDAAKFRKHGGALQEVVKSFKALDVKQD
jgi:hypothetical protein